MIMTFQNLDQIKGGLSKKKFSDKLKGNLIKY